MRFDCICNLPVRRLGSVAADAALAAADVVGAVAVVAEQSVVVVVVVVSSIRPEMRMRCAGVGWARQPQTPILELEPEICQRKINITAFRLH